MSGTVHVASTQPFFIRTGILSSSVVSGSAFLSKPDGLKLICSVSGPSSFHQSRQSIQYSDAWNQGKISVHVTYSPFSYAAYVQRRNNKEEQDFLMQQYRKLPSVLSDTFESVILTESFPHCEVEIALSVIECQAYESLVAPAINCISLALLDAKIPERGICSSVAIALTTPPRTVNKSTCVNKITDTPGVSKPDIKYITDPTQSQLDAETTCGVAIVALSSPASHLVYLETNCDLNVVSKKHANHPLHVAQSVCSQLNKAFAQYIREEATANEAKQASKKTILDEYTHRLEVDRMSQSIKSPKSQSGKGRLQ